MIILKDELQPVNPGMITPEEKRRPEIPGTITPEEEHRPEIPGTITPEEERRPEIPGTITPEKTPAPNIPEPKIIIQRPVLPPAAGLTAVTQNPEHRPAVRPVQTGNLLSSATADLPRDGCPGLRAPFGEWEPVSPGRRLRNL
jgi:hypothetical protein